MMCRASSSLASALKSRPRSLCVRTSTSSFAFLSRRAARSSTRLTAVATSAVAERYAAFERAGHGVQGWCRRGEVAELGGRLLEKRALDPGTVVRRPDELLRERPEG